MAPQPTFIDRLEPDLSGMGEALGFMSPISTTAAPRVRAAPAAARQTGSAPATYTVESTPTLAVTAP
jgi:hypothetical protein